MAALIDVRFVVYNLETVVDILPTPADWAWAWAFGDDPTLRLTYSKLSPGGELARTLLDNEYDVALQVNHRTGNISSPWTGWFEPPMARFVMTEDADDPTDPTSMISFTGVGAVAYDLQGVVEYLTAKINPDSGEVNFTNATPGKLVRTWVNDGKAAGACTAVTLTFNDTTDSLGQAWKSGYSKIGVRPDQTARQLVEMVQTQYLADWESRGNSLYMFNPDTELMRKRDGTAGVEVTLALGRELTDARQSRSRRGYISNVLAITDKGKPYNLSKPIVSRRGRRFAVAQSGGITTEADANIVAEGIFAQSARLIREQLTRTLKLESSNLDFLPIRDYRPGDYVLAPGSEGKIESLRVRVLTLTGGSDGLGGNVVLNDRFLEAAVKTARQYASISGGSTAITGGGRPAVPESGKRLPKAPSSVSGNGIAYVNNNGQATGQAIIQWAEVSTDDNNIPIGVARYRVRARKKVVVP